MLWKEEYERRIDIFSGLSRVADRFEQTGFLQAFADLISDTKKQEERFIRSQLASSQGVVDDYSVWANTNIHMQSLKVLLSSLVDSIYSPSFGRTGGANMLYFADATPISSHRSSVLKEKDAKVSTRVVRNLQPQLNQAKPNSSKGSSLAQTPKSNQSHKNLPHDLEKHHPEADNLTKKPKPAVPTRHSDRVQNKPVKPDQEAEHQPSRLRHNEYQDPRQSKSSQPIKDFDDSVASNSMAEDSMPQKEVFVAPNPNPAPAGRDSSDPTVEEHIEYKEHTIPIEAAGDLDVNPQGEQIATEGDEFENESPFEDDPAREEIHPPQPQLYYDYHFTGAGSNLKQKLLGTDTPELDSEFLRGGSIGSKGPVIGTAKRVLEEFDPETIAARVKVPGPGKYEVSKAHRFSRSTSPKDVTFTKDTRKPLFTEHSKQNVPGPIYTPTHQFTSKGPAKKKKPLVDQPQQP